MKVKINSFSILLLVTLLFSPVAQAETFPAQKGEHNGDALPLDYWIEYLNPSGTTIVGESGITFDPFFGPTSFSPEEFPEEYFADYALYFTGETLSFRVHIKNNEKRTYKNLLVITQQELFNQEGESGVLFPEPNTHKWVVEELKSGEEIVLEGTMTIPSFGESGLDQTHLQIIHWDKTHSIDDDVSGGRIIVDDSQAGIWCPVG